MVATSSAAEDATPLDSGTSEDTRIESPPPARLTFRSSTRAARQPSTYPTHSVCLPTAVRSAAPRAESDGGATTIRFLSQGIL